MKNTPLTVSLHVCGKQIDTLTEEQRERMAQKIAEAMNTYYSAQHNEFPNIKH